MNGHGHEFGHEFMSESMSEADSDTDMRLFGTSDTDSDTDMDKVMTSDTDTGSDKGMSENLGHGLGHRQTSDTLVRSSLLGTTLFSAHLRTIVKNMEKSKIM